MDQGSTDPPGLYLTWKLTADPDKMVCSVAFKVVTHFLPSKYLLGAILMVLF